MKKILLIGGGGHCKSVLQGMKRDGCAVYGIVDKENGLKRDVLGVPTIGTDVDLSSLAKQGCLAIVTVGSVKNNDARRGLYDKACSAGLVMTNYISKEALISEGVSFGKGTVVLDRVIINVDTKIGNNCIINTGAIVEHDCVVDDHVHIASGAVLSGGVTVGELAFIGAASVIRQGVRIGRGAVVGAGAVVVDDVPDNATFVGDRARSV